MYKLTTTSLSVFSTIILLELTAQFALGQLVPQSKPAVAGKPAAVVRSLYRVVVARHPIGIPWGRDRKALAPYLSKDLIHKLDVAQACGEDYNRQHPDPNEKPQIEWLELGLFSGANENALPAAFHVENAHLDKDGSFRVRLRLTYRDSYKTYGRPPTEANTFRWYVDVIVVRENGHFGIDNVIYLKDEGDPRDVEPPLSQVLSEGCDGSRWVGYGEERSDPR